jgi:hypothetical protein
MTLKTGRLAASILAAFTIALISAAPVLAEDGVFEINQVKLNTSSFPGTYIIQNPGSYKLTSNLTESGSNDVIDVFANNVTIDLNGFTIFGSGTASSLAISDINAGSGHTGLTIRNGQLSGFDAGGCLEVFNHANTTVDHVTGNGCGLFANVGKGSHVTNSASTTSVITSNSTGVSCPSGGGCVVTGNVISVASPGFAFFFGLTDATTLYGGNVITGTVEGGVSLKNNVCVGSATNPC